MNEKGESRLPNIEATFGYSGSEIAEQAPGCRLVPLSATRHQISVREFFTAIRAPSNTPLPVKTIPRAIPLAWS